MTNTKSFNQEEIDINKKYSIEERRANIKSFIKDNSNQDGVDLNPLYLARLIYTKGNEENMEDEQFSNKVTLVYRFPDSDNENLYMDLFKERLLKKTTYTIPGILSFAPFVRKGLTATCFSEVREFLGKERETLENLEILYGRIKDLDYYDFLKNSVELQQQSINESSESSLKRR